MQGTVRVMAAAFVLATGLGLGSEESASAATPGWTRQFGTSGADEAQGVALDPAGDAYVAGWVFGSLAGQGASGTVDAFLRKYDSGGKEVWTHQFGSFDRDFARAVAVGDGGCVYVVGETDGALPGQRSAGGRDAFVRKYDAAGIELWTRQFGGRGGEWASGVALDEAGNAYVVGATGATFPGTESAGSFDAYVRKYNPAGDELWTRQFGGTGGDSARAVAVDAAGDAIVVGSTDGGLPGHMWAGGFDAFVRKYDAAGRELWTDQFGSAANDYGIGAAVDGADRTWVVGSADGALPGQASAGTTDAFIRQIDRAGTVLWTEQFGTGTVDDAWGVAVDAAGHAQVVGSTERDLPGQRSAGSSDFFVRRYDENGDEVGTQQFGTADIDLGLAIALDPAGRAHAVGSTLGTFPGQASAGGRDAVIVKLA